MPRRAAFADDRSMASAAGPAHGRLTASPMQMLRLAFVVFIAALAIALLIPVRSARAQGGFDAFLADLRKDAAAMGVSDATFEAAFEGVRPDPRIVALTRKQGEFALSVGAYLSAALPASRVAQGQSLARRWARELGVIEARYGVPSAVVVAVWGMESNYGAAMGREDTIQALASLAHARYRGDYFRDELLTALQILEQGHVDHAHMRGSWAGAMGQTQFMPSSFMKHAVDFDGDGRKDIWTSTPDALASTANFLKNNGWDPNDAFAREAILPQGYRPTVADQAGELSYSEWTRRGLRRADGEPWPSSGRAQLFLPAGLSGPAFLRSANFEVIRAYNTSSAYALAVGLLADRIDGAGPLKAPWPDAKPPTLAHGIEAQKRLVALGLDVGKVDGRFGEKARAAIRQWQEKNGLIPDGEPSPAVIHRLRAER
jgi:lytic murein transglycosylase